MQCLRCGCQSFTAKNIVIDPIGDCAAWVCDNCEEPLMDTDQMDNTLKRWDNWKTPLDRHKERVAKSNENWLKRDAQKSGQKHPWKTNLWYKSKREVDKLDN